MWQYVGVYCKRCLVHLEGRRYSGLYDPLEYSDIENGFLGEDDLGVGNLSYEDNIHGRSSRHECQGERIGLRV